MQKFPEFSLPSWPHPSSSHAKKTQVPLSDKEEHRRCSIEKPSEAIIAAQCARPSAHRRNATSPTQSVDGRWPIESPNNSKAEELGLNGEALTEDHSEARRLHVDRG